MSTQPAPTRVRFTVERAELDVALAYVVKPLPKYPSTPVLGGVLVEANDLGVTVSTFDYETSRTVTLKSSVSIEHGRVLLPGSQLAEMVKKLPKKGEKVVTVAVTGTQAEILCQRARFTLQTMPVEDYPPLPEMPDQVGTIDVGVFAGAVEQAAVAAGRDETLPMMTCVHMSADKATLTLAATDRDRLVIRELAWPGQDFAALVPARTLFNAMKVLAKVKGGHVAIGCEGPRGDGKHDTGMLGLTCGPYRMTTRLGDGTNYPPVRALMPKAFIAGAEFDGAEMVEVIQRVMAGVGSKTSPVMLDFGIGRVAVSAGDEGDAGGSEPVGCEFMPGTQADRAEVLKSAVAKATKTAEHRTQFAPADERSEAVTAAVTAATEEVDRAHGQGLTLGANPAYLIDAIKTAGTQRVRFRLVNRVLPFLVQPVVDGSEVPGVWHLLMPIKVIKSEAPKADVKPAQDSAGASNAEVNAVSTSDVSDVSESKKVEVVPASTPVVDVDPLDLARIRVAVEDHAASWYRTPMVGGDRDSVARYVSEGLHTLCGWYSLRVVWDHVAQVIEDRPELLTLTAEEVQAAAAARVDAVEEMASRASVALRAGEFADASKLIDAAELLLPDHALQKGGCGYTWPQLRRKIEAKRLKSSSDVAEGADAAPAVASKASIVEIAGASRGKVMIMPVSGFGFAPTPKAESPVEVDVEPPVVEPPVVEPPVVEPPVVEPPVVEPPVVEPPVVEPPVVENVPAPVVSVEAQPFGPDDVARRLSALVGVPAVAVEAAKAAALTALTEVPVTVPTATADVPAVVDVSEIEARLLAVTELPGHVVQAAIVAAKAAVAGVHAPNVAAAGVAVVSAVGPERSYPVPATLAVRQVAKALRSALYQSQRGLAEPVEFSVLADRAGRTLRVAVTAGAVSDGVWSRVDGLVGQVFGTVLVTV